MGEIKARCPYCGGHDLTVKPVWTDYRFVACKACKAAGPVRKSAEEAISAFEHRFDGKVVHVSFSEDEQAFCPECYGKVEPGDSFCKTCGARVMVRK